MADQIITAIAAAAACIGLFYAGRQLQLSRSLAKHQFMLQFYQLMDEHNAVHLRAREYSEDEFSGSWPDKNQDWLQIGRVLGLFEYLNRLVDDGVVTIDHVDESYAYRLVPLLKVPKIKEFVFDASGAWCGVIALEKKLRSKPIYSKLVGEGINFPVSTGC